jgi:hypothetical protein
VVSISGYVHFCRKGICYAQHESVVLPSTTKGPKGQMRPAPNNIYILHPPPLNRRLFCLFFCSRGPEGHLPGPSMPPVYSTSRWKAKLQSLELSNLSCSHCNLVAHIPIPVLLKYRLWSYGTTCLPVWETSRVYRETGYGTLCACALSQASSDKNELSKVTQVKNYVGCAQRSSTKHRLKMMRRDGSTPENSGKWQHG